MTQDGHVAAAKRLKGYVFGKSYVFGTVGIGKEADGSPSLYIYAKEVTPALKELEHTGFEGMKVYVKKIQWPLKAN